jgi:hypothetical protein
MAGAASILHRFNPAEARERAGLLQNIRAFTIIEPTAD